MNTEERVELHCHSKFSGNAVMYAGEIIRHLGERSMPAVAITDTSNILAFPVFEIKEILKNREGLLLGSGACRAHKKADRACRLHG